MKNCVSKMLGVESKGVPGIEGSTWSAAAMVCLCGMTISAMTLSQEEQNLRGKESDNLGWGEAASVGEASKDAIDGVERLGDGQVGSGLSRIGASNEDGELGCTRAVADTDCASELDAV